MTDQHADDVRVYGCPECMRSWEVSSEPVTPFLCNTCYLALVECVCHETSSRNCSLHQNAHIDGSIAAETLDDGSS